MIFRHHLGLVVILMSVGASKPSVLEQNRHHVVPEVCKSDDCHTMANVIISAMNKNANPCEDFYDYACGAWTDSNHSQAPAERATWNRMTMFNRKLSEKLRTILESNKFNSVPVEKAKRWYRSCMNEEALESRGIEPIVSIANAVGGWPIAMALGQWNPSDYTWQEIEIYYSRVMGSYAMYNVVININADNGTANEILIKAPGLPFSKGLQVSRRFFDPQDRKSYAKVIAGVARAFANAEGAKISDGKIAKEVEDMIDFEMRLDKYVQFSFTDVILKSNISGMQRLLDTYMPNKTEISDINLLKLIKNLIEGIGGIEITEHEIISVEASYVTYLSQLLNRTSFRTIVNYVHWHYLSRVLHMTTSEMRKLVFEFMKETLGIKKQLPRWEQCVNQMELNHALAHQFVLEYFTEDIYHSGSEMISNIQREMENQIDGSTWMNDETKKLMREKLWNIKALIGSPDWYTNSTVFNEYYEGLTIGNDYFINVLKYKRFTAKKTIGMLRKANSQPDWLTDPITINAFYIVNANSLNIPAAVFQPPLFTSLMPQSVKYGILGSILGHELSHGFDDTGCRYDKNGNAINWPADMLGAYTLRSRCFVQQYRDLTNATDMEMAVLGPLTIGENIADTTGVQSVFGAYRSIVEKIANGDKKLPGFEDFSDEKLFFLSYATIWCEMSTSEYKRKKFLSSDPHSPARFRVLATMSNNEAFARAFNCAEGSPMNPSRKCNIWTGKPVGSWIDVD